MASRSPESLGRRITSLIVVTVALVLTALAGAAVFFASAALFDSVPMLTLCAIITVIVCSYGAGRLWARMARKPVPALNLLACATIFGLVCANDACVAPSASADAPTAISERRVM